MNAPSLGNLDLAYETGVHLGDGNLWDNRYLISGNRTNETQYYEEVLSPLVQDLYSLNPTIAFQNNSIYLRVYSKELVLFKHNELGLPIGRKEGLRMPTFAVGNRQVIANVVSGLYDTDGSVKIRRDSSGNYPRISIGQKHRQILVDTSNFLRPIGITSTLYRNDYFDSRSGQVQTRWFLDINGFRNFDLFVKHVGTRSPYVAMRMKDVEAYR